MAMEDILVPYVPAEYLRQPTNDHCGFYSVHSVLSALGVAPYSTPEEYPKSLVERLTGATTPWRLAGLLREFGIGCQVRTAVHSRNQEKMEVILGALSKGHPVIILIGSPGKFAGTLRGKLRERYMGHWVSVWGKGGGRFLVYDSARDPEAGLPIGNSSRPEKELLSAWGKLPYAPYVYLEITSLPASSNAVVTRTRHDIATSIENDPGKH